ncbi:hypothetical protein L7F22_062954 [Adiantum nelumboides]|nr:hypothetical protein [Adiantum nelumboides]
MSKNDGISGLVSDKLDKNNFHAWKFRMTNFLMGKGYWDYIDGNQEEMPDLPDVNPTAEQIKAFKDWNQGARKVMYWLSVSVHDTMIGNIQDATSPKQAWDRFLVCFTVLFFVTGYWLETVELFRFVSGSDNWLAVTQITGLVSFCLWLETVTFWFWITGFQIQQIRLLVSSVIASLFSGLCNWLGTTVLVLVLSQAWTGSITVTDWFLVMLNRSAHLV